MTDPTKHRHRFRPVASLFATRHYDICEPKVQASISNDFIFSDVPDEFKSLKSEAFDDPLTIATYGAINWTVWFSRNFPKLQVLVSSIPRSFLSRFTGAFEPTLDVTDIMTALVRHEKREGAPKRENCMMQRLINAHLGDKSKSKEPLSEAALEAEAEVTMWGGIIDLSNILPFGTFMVSQSPQLQQELYEELRSAWPDIRAPAPLYEDLRQLPILVGIPYFITHHGICFSNYALQNGVVKESLRLTFGVATGPARLVGPEGALIDGHHVPAKVISIVYTEGFLMLV
ncbi:hypothetical protein jhhlp_002905 [Lomentospora prolificans]|uniref:Uncharacterized protein n=1 Tax=Lomentospora prolificans TaxID=41688 RepID=A0A2N3NFD0_9PEZI|nr:hypothetical protein jhhlp_002905 [Lomentospora prolificans]